MANHWNFSIFLWSVEMQESVSDQIQLSWLFFILGYAFKQLLLKIKGLLPSLIWAELVKFLRSYSTNSLENETRIFFLCWQSAYKNAVLYVEVVLCKNKHIHYELWLPMFNKCCSLGTEHMFCVSDFPLVLAKWCYFLWTFNRKSPRG